MFLSGSWINRVRINAWVSLLTMTYAQCTSPINSLSLISTLYSLHWFISFRLQVTVLNQTISTKLDHSIVSIWEIIWICWSPITLQFRLFTYISSRCVTFLAHFHSFRWWYIKLQIKKNQFFNLSIRLVKVHPSFRLTRLNGWQYYSTGCITFIS